jgi:MarR family transcriptional regulator, organic hydroperoxide resistance regulator
VPIRKSSIPPNKSAKQVPAEPVAPVDASYLQSMIWDLGRAYFAYVGLLERVLVEQKLDHILRPGMGVVLFSLYERDCVSIKELAERSQLACSTLTGVLQRMEDAGVVTRTRDDTDGRSVRVALTPVGMGLKAKCHEVARRMTQVSQQGVGESNTELCSQFLQGLTQAYRREEHRLCAVVSQKPSAKKASGEK